MSILFIIFLLALILVAGYFARRTYGGYTAFGILGLIVLLLLVIGLFGGFGHGYLR